MRFIKNALLRDERLIYATHPHWIIFAPSVIIFIMMAAIFILGPQYPLFGFRLFGYAFYDIVGAIVGLVAVYWFLSAWVVFYYSEFGVTNKRIIMKTGMISRDTAEIMLDKIEAINVEQSILGRILTYGTLIVVGTGGTHDVYYNVPDPFIFRRQAQRQVSRTEI